MHPISSSTNCGIQPETHIKEASCVKLILYISSNLFVGKCHRVVSTEELTYLNHMKTNQFLSCTAAISNSFGFGGHNSCIVIAPYNAWQYVCKGQNFLAVCRLSCWIDLNLKKGDRIIMSLGCWVRKGLGLSKGFHCTWKGHGCCFRQSWVFVN
jgi:hypothetical protein